jgi:hypothetical protein
MPRPGGVAHDPIRLPAVAEFDQSGYDPAGAGPVIDDLDDRAAGVVAGGRDRRGSAFRVDIEGEHRLPDEAAPGTA